MRRQPPAFCRGPGVRVNTDVGDRAFAFARALNYDPIARMDASPDDGARLTRVELVLRSSTGMSAVVAQMVRAPDCGSGGPRFDPEQRYHFFFAGWMPRKPITETRSCSLVPVRLP